MADGRLLRETSHKYGCDPDQNQQIVGWQCNTIATAPSVVDDDDGNSDDDNDDNDDNEDFFKLLGTIINNTQ